MIEETRSCGCRYVRRGLDDGVVYPCEQHGGTRTNGGAMPTPPAMPDTGKPDTPGLHLPTSVLLGFLLLIALALIAAALALTFTGHSAQDAWWGLGLVIAGITGIHVPPPR